MITKTKITTSRTAATVRHGCLSLMALIGTDWACSAARSAAPPDGFGCVVLMGYPFDAALIVMASIAPSATP